MSDDQKAWAKTLAAKQKVMNDAKAAAQKTSVEQDVARIKRKIETAVERDDTFIRVEEICIHDDALNLLRQDGVALTPVPSWARSYGAAYNFQFLV